MRCILKEIHDSGCLHGPGAVDGAVRDRDARIMQWWNTII